MESKIFQDTPDSEREAMLEANSTDTMEKDVQVYYTPEQMTQLRADYAANSILIRKSTEKLNKAKDEWKAETKAPADQNEYLIKNIRLGFQEVPQQVYVFCDYENGMVGEYDNQGNLLESRRMRPEERQMKVK